MILAMIVIVIFGFLFYQLQESDIWSTPTFIILRWLLFIPVSLILLSFIFSTPNIVFNMIYDFAWWQIMLILIFAVGLLTMFFQAEDGIRDLVRSRGLGDVYKRQVRKKQRKTFSLSHFVPSFLCNKYRHH